MATLSHLWMRIFKVQTKMIMKKFRSILSKKIKIGLNSLTKSMKMPILILKAIKPALIRPKMMTTSQRIQNQNLSLTNTKKTKNQKKKMLPRSMSAILFCYLLLGISTEQEIKKSQSDLTSLKERNATTTSHQLICLFE